MDADDPDRAARIAVVSEWLDRAIAQFDRDRDRIMADAERRDAEAARTRRWRIERTPAEGGTHD